MEGTQGYFRIQPFKDLLVVRSYGFWDGRIASVFSGEVEQTIQEHYKGRSWSLLHDARAWELGTPEIEAIIPRMMMTPITGTLTHHALVTGASEVKQWQITRMFDSLVVPYENRLFEEMDAARAWLTSAGYTIPALGE